MTPLTTAPSRAEQRWIAAESAAQARRARQLAVAQLALAPRRARGILEFLSRVQSRGLHVDGETRRVLSPDELPVRPRGAVRVMAEAHAAARPHLERYLNRDARWRALALPGFGRGLRFKMLSLDATSGACSLKLALAARFRQDGGFSRSALELYVLSGSLELGRHRHGAGSYLYVPRGVALPELRSARGAEALAFYNDGPPSLVPSDSDHPDGERLGLSAIDAHQDLAWRPPGEQPADAPGVLVKLLRTDPVTGACTRLVAWPPQFRRDAVGFRDSGEETYQLRGTLTTLQFGDLPTGGYCWRPAFVNHGPLAASQGALAFSRTDGEPVLHFQASPWTTPQENRRRAREALEARRPALFAVTDPGRRR